MIEDQLLFVRWRKRAVKGGGLSKVHAVHYGKFSTLCGQNLPTTRKATRIVNPQAQQIKDVCPECAVLAAKEAKNASIE